MDIAKALDECALPLSGAEWRARRLSLGLDLHEMGTLTGMTGAYFRALENELVKPSAKALATIEEVLKNLPTIGTGEELRKRRNELRLTVGDVVSDSGISHSLIEKIEKGLRTRQRTKRRMHETLERLAGLRNGVPLLANGQAIRDRRREAGLSRTALGRAAGICQETIGRIERGESPGLPRTLDAIERALAAPEKRLAPSKVWPKKYANRRTKGQTASHRHATESVPASNISRNILSNISRAKMTRLPYKLMQTADILKAINRYKRRGLELAECFDEVAAELGLKIGAVKMRYYRNRPASN